MRVRITAGMFKGQTGFVKSTGWAGVYVRHTLPPLFGRGGFVPREGTCDSWFSWVSLEELKEQL